MARVVTVNERDYRMLETADDITADIERAIAEAVEWFDDSPTMGAQEFIDRLCNTYGEGGGNAPGFDLDSYDNAAARKILRIARAIRKESRA